MTIGLIVCGALGKEVHALIQKHGWDAELIGDDAYTDGFQWGAEEEKPGSAQEVAQSAAAEIEAQFQQIDVKSIANKLKK